MILPTHTKERGAIKTSQSEAVIAGQQHELEKGILSLQKAELVGTRV
jgi:hypothetical protein